jgi:hypothetical protein
MSLLFFLVLDASGFFRHRYSIRPEIDDTDVCPSIIPFKLAVLPKWCPGSIRDCLDHCMLYVENLTIRYALIDLVGSLKR